MCLTVQYDPTAPALTAAPTFPSVTSTTALLAGSSVQDLHSGLLDLQWNIDRVEYVYTSTSFSSNVLDLTMLSEGSHTCFGSGQSQERPMVEPCVRA